MYVEILGRVCLYGQHIDEQNNFVDTSIEVFQFISTDFGDTEGK